MDCQTLKTAAQNESFFFIENLRKFLIRVCDEKWQSETYR